MADAVRLTDGECSRSRQVFLLFVVFLLPLHPLPYHLSYPTSFSIISDAPQLYLKLTGHMLIKALVLLKANSALKAMPE